MSKQPEVKPIICFRHDECIFKQFILTGRSWKGPNGETAVVPKDEGAGVMISAFPSHEFGFGLHFIGEQLKEMNNYHEGKFYSDADAEMATRQSKQKKPLNSRLFIQEFEYGKANERYWTYQ